MLTRRLRESFAREEGQALVLACVMLLVLSVAVLTTVNLGHTLSERIRLQNTADAAAYSMAVAEARAFNFYAFANRTQVSHYVSAMVWQSLNSFLYFLEAFLTDLYAVMRTLNPCAGGGSGPFWAVVCPAIIEQLPVVGPLIAALDALLESYRLVLKGFQDALAQLDPDRLIGQDLIPAHRALNGVLAAASTAVMAATLLQVQRSASDIVRANDPNLGPQSTQLPMSALSACMFDRAHFEEANGRPFAPRSAFSPIEPRAVREQEKAARAKRAMAQVANASRFACDSEADSRCKPQFVTSRGALDLLSVPGWFGPLKDLMAEAPKRGQTRLLSHRLARGEAPSAADPKEARSNNLRQWRGLSGVPMGHLGQGDALGADDSYQLKLGPSSVGVLGVKVRNPLSCDDADDRADCWGDPRTDVNDRLETSVWSLGDEDLDRGGIHWRLVRPGVGGSRADREVGVSRREVALVSVAGAPVVRVPLYVARVERDLRDDSHAWPGLVPFPHFEPGQYERACEEDVLERGVNPALNRAALRATEFNQPSTFALLQKGARQLRNPLADPTGATRSGPALLNDEGRLRFDFGGRAELVLENDRAAVPGHGAGLIALSRAQVYYHRPGNWAEQPNFFNPYWRPRLASVYQGRHALPLVGQLEAMLPPQLSDRPQKVMTH